MLTRKQLHLTRFIQVYMAQNVIAPSYEEMMRGTGEKPKSGINRIVTSLEERGFIRRIPHRARALEIVRKVPIS